MIAWFTANWKPLTLAIMATLGATISVLLAWSKVFPNSPLPRWARWAHNKYISLWRLVSEIYKGGKHIG